MTTGRINQVTILRIPAHAAAARGCRGTRHLRRAGPDNQRAPHPGGEGPANRGSFPFRKELKLFIVTPRLFGMLSVFFARKRAVMREQRRPEVLRSRHVARRLQFASPWLSLAGSHPERPQCFFLASPAGTEARKLERNRTDNTKNQACWKVPRWRGLPRQRSNAT